MPDKTHYEVLGVSPTATDKEIKTAYRKRARETHPDFGGTVEAAAAVNEAADVLLDAQKRAGYDYDLRKAAQKRPGAGRSSASAGPDPFAWTRTPPAPKGPEVVECPHCGAKNRVKAESLDAARCGTCKKPLKDSLGAIWSDLANGLGGRVRDPLKTVDDLLAKAEGKLRETREAMEAREAKERATTDAFGRAQSTLDELDEWERKLKG
jgi:curved DNA-binding protein CbpA